MDIAMEYVKIISSLIQKVTSLNVHNAQSVMKWKTDISVTFMVIAKNAQHILIQIHPKPNVNHVSQVQEKFSCQLDNVKPALIILSLIQLAYSVWMLPAQKHDKKFFQTEHAKPALITLPHFTMKLPNHGHVLLVEEKQLEKMKLLKLTEVAVIAMLRKVNLDLAKMVHTVSAT